MEKLLMKLLELYLHNIKIEREEIKILLFFCCYEKYYECLSLFIKIITYISIGFNLEFDFCVLVLLKSVRRKESWKNNPYPKYKLSNTFFIKY